MDTASLRLLVDSTQAVAAAGNLNKLATSGARAERATDGLRGGFAALAGQIAIGATAVAGFNKLLNTQREFDRINAGLITATGSAEEAARAFEAIQDFASTTPYSLQQAAEGFTKLVNLGLEPGERALTSYGNTAAAMGKNLNDMIEAVADAATGEFERLKEFGIRASSQGDRVSLTFRGVSTNIGKNAAEIEQYLIALGENEFAGAMANRMATLDGAMSNLSDEWDKLFLNVSQSGVGDMIADGVKGAIDTLAELNAMLASGEMESLLQAFATNFSGYTDDMAEAWRMMSEGFEGETSNVVGFIIEAIQDLPVNFRSMVAILVTELASGFDRMVAGAEFWRDSMKAIFTDDTVDAAAARFASRMEQIQEARLGSIESIMAERDATLAQRNALQEEARARREAYDAEQAARRAAGGDRLSGYRTGADGGSEGGGGTGGQTAAQRRAFESLVASLQTEEEAVATSYARRLAIIEANTAAGSEARARLTDRLTQERDEELNMLAEKQGRELSSLIESLQTEEQELASSYERRRQIVLTNTQAGSEQQTALLEQLRLEYEADVQNYQLAQQRKRDSLFASLLTEEESLTLAYERQREQILMATEITELERQDLLRRLTQQFHAEQEQMERARMETQLAGAAALFDGLSGLAKAYGGEQSKTYKALFAVSKAFSVAQAIMSITTGIAKAQELGFPLNLAEMARVAATGAGIISTLRGSNFSGAYDEGGQIAAGKWGIVGENGPEIVRGPASVTGRELTARHMGEGGGMNISISNTVVLQSDGTASTTTKSNEGNNEARLLNEAITGRVKQVLVEESRPGGMLWRMKNG